MMRNRSVLVTGGTGFLGSHLVRRVIAEGAGVHVFARSESSLWRLQDVLADVTLWRGNLSDCDSLRRCLDGAMPEIVFHLGGLTDVRWLDRDLTQIDRSVDINLKGTLNLLGELHRGGSPVQSFIRAGGLEEYGNGQSPYREQQRESPVSPYSASQVAAAHYCQMLQQYVGFAIVTLRPALIYGPAQATTFFIPSLIMHCVNHRDFEMESGEHGRDLIFVDDAVEAFIRAAAKADLRGEIINVGTGKEHRMRDVAETILRMTGAAICLKIGVAPKRPSQIEHLFCQPDKARVLLDWSPKTSLEEGLAQTIHWYREHRDGINSRG